MDGMYSDLSRKMFILTTNNRWINDNLIARPSRIRYFKQFNDISLEVLSSYIDDNLIDKSRKNEILKFVDQLRDCTIDIVKAVVEEINMHNCSLETIEKYMNLTKETYTYQVYYCEKGDHHIDSMSKFIETCGRIGSTGLDKHGDNRPYLLGNDLGLSKRRINFYKKFDELKIGSFMDDDEELEIVSIKDNYIEVKTSYDDIYYYKVLDPQYVNSLYGDKILNYIY